MGGECYVATTRCLHFVGIIKLMPQPLNYRNPKPADAEPSPPKAVVSTAVPVEFDMLLIRTEDHAAVSAIEKALARKRIACFGGEEGSAARRETALYVRPADRDRAFEVAGEIFARRHKFRSYPRQQAPPDSEGLNRRIDPISVWP
jgi:hypothetical protein